MQKFWFSVGLGQHVDRLDLLKGCRGVIPEVNWHAPSHVAAIAVDVEFAHPVFESIDHALAHLWHIKVEVGHVCPFGIRWHHIALTVLGVPIFVVGDPRVVERGVVSHPVENHFHTLGVSAVDEFAQVGLGAEVWVHSVVVGHRIGRAH